MAGITSQFLPSREMYKDYSAEANIYNQTLGDTPLSPFMNIAKGISEGIDLGNKANAFIRDNSAEGAERRRLDLETKRAQASAIQSSASIQAIQARHAAILDQAELLSKQTKLQEETLKGQSSVREQQLLVEAYKGMEQIQDARSLGDFLSDPRFIPLKANAQFGSVMRNQAAQLIPGAAPEEQVRLVQMAEALSPGSGAKLEPLLSSEAQNMTISPARTGARGSASKENTALFEQQVLTKFHKEAKPGFEVKGYEVHSGTGDDAGNPAGEFMVLEHPETKERQLIEMNKFLYGSPTQKAAQKAIVDNLAIRMDTIARQNALDKKNKTGLHSDVPGVAKGDPTKNRVNVSKDIQLDAREKATKAALGIDYENDVANPYVKQIDAVVSTSASKGSYGDQEKRAVERLADELVVKEGLTGVAAKNRKAGIMQGAVTMYRNTLRRKKASEELQSKIKVSGMTSPTPVISPTPSDSPMPNSSPMPISSTPNLR